MIKKYALTLWVMFCCAASAWAGEAWEKNGDYYFLTKNTRQFFSAPGAGSNTFAGKYVSFDGVAFLVRGAKDWTDYGRLDLRGNHLFVLPIRPGAKVDEVHLLAGGNYSNSYKDDPLLKLYGDNYYYGVLNIIFAYEDGTFQALSVPVFWDWFHLGQREWSRDGATIKGLGINPVRKDCSMYHIRFMNPQPQKPLKAILLSDSWLGDMPFSDVFALTLKSSDSL